MVVNLSETLPKDINGNYTRFLESSTNQSKRYYHFSESPRKFIVSHESESSNEPSKGVKNVLLGPPSEEMIVNCSNDYLNDGDIKTLILNNNNNDNQSGQMVGQTVSVSTCSSCGIESKPIVNVSNCSVKINEAKLKESHIDSSSSRSTPVREYYQNYYSNNGKKSMNGSLSSSPRVEKSLRLKGCHICKQSPSSSLSLSSSRKKITDNCPYSIVFDSFHPAINRYNLNYRSGNGSNQSSGSKEETRRALIMIFTITSILLFLMITYYGAIIYLRMRNINSK